MLKGKSVLEIKKGDKVYTFEFEPGSHAGEIHDVLHEMKAFVVSKIIEVQASSKPVSEQQPEETKVCHLPQE